MTGRTRLETARTAARWLIAAAYLYVGIVHVTRPGFFLPIVPGWVPAPRLTVIATGVCEILGAFGIMTTRLRRFAGIMLALYAVCVFPANIKHAMDDLGHGSGLGWWYHGPRLLLQPVLVWWALFAGGAVTWPFRPRR